MKNSSNIEHLRAYNKLHQHLVDRGFTPQLQKLDNEASAAFKRTICKKNIDFQLVPPHMHQRNAAECAICTFKNHYSLWSRCQVSITFMGPLTTASYYVSQPPPELAIKSQTIRQGTSKQNI
jgi:hypothetical protein